MQKTFRLMLTAAFALMLAAPAAIAQTPEYSTLPITEPTLVGDTVLEPGTYTIRVLPSTLNRNRVQVTRADGSVAATALTVPHPLEPNEEVPNAMYVFYPPVEGQARVLRTWFARFPEASQGGHDFVYDEARARQLARASNSRVVAYSAQTNTADLDNATLNVVTPEATVETYTYTAPAPQIAETRRETTTVTTPTPAPAPVQVAEARRVEMPDTASNVPLIGLLGALALVGAAAVRFTRS